MPNRKRDILRKRFSTTQNRRVLTRVKRVLRAHLPEFREQYHVKSLGVFGSYLRGEQKKNSDLDVLVEFEQSPTLFQYVHLQRAMSQMIGVNVDLVLKDTLKPAIGRRILSEVVTL